MSKRGSSGITGRLPVAAAALATVALIAACGSNSATHFCQDTVYPEEDTSLYILPYEGGSGFTVGQGNCVEAGTGSHAQGLRAEFAYDMLMPVGTSLVAVRSGVVLYVEESFEAAERGDGNSIVIQHDDETISNYGHIALSGAFVDEGDTVTQSEIIGSSGNTGRSSEPHLHFEVLDCSGDPLVRDLVVSFNSTCHSVPTTFANTRPHQFGLVEGEEHTAESLAR